MATQLRNGELTRRPTSSKDSLQEEEEGEEERENAEQEEEEMVEKLEEEVREIAERVKDYRSTLPHHLNSALSSLLSSQRPPLFLSSGPHLPGAESVSGSSSRVSTTGDDERAVDEVKLLRDKLSNNISAMPKILKRMNDCISRIDKLGSSCETIHPVFKRKKS